MAAMRHVFLVLGLVLVTAGLLGALSGQFSVPGGGGGPSTGILQGYVADCQSGNPVWLATVTATASTTFSTQTGLDGSYSMIVALGYTYTITASASGYVSQTLSKTVLSSGATANFQLVTTYYKGACGASTVKQSFQVQDAVTTYPVSGATIALTASATTGVTTASGTTDSTGTATISLTSGYSYSVMVSASGYYSRTFTMTPPTGAAYPVSLTPTSGGGCGATCPPAPAKILTDFSSTTNGLAASFTANATGGNGGPYTYTWSFGDGGTASGVTASHTYTAAGTYTVSLVTSDSSGNFYAGSASHSLTVSAGGNNNTPPPPPPPPANPVTKAAINLSPLAVFLIVIGAIFVVVAAFVRS